MESRAQIDPLDVARVNLSMLESLFGPDWFAERRNPGHAAFKRWQYIQDFIQSGGTVVPTTDEGLMSLAELELDGYHLLEACGGNMVNARQGLFANYGDNSVRTRIRAVVQNESQYFAVMTELARAAFHIQRGHGVQARELPNRADLRVLVPGLEVPLLVECKRLSAAAGIERVAQVIKNANSQIKEENAANLGIVVLDATEQTRLLRIRSVWPSRRRHVIPERILEIKRAIRAALDVKKRDHVSGALVPANTSVSCVVLVWNEITIRPDIFDSKRVIINKKCEVVFHKEPLGSALDIGEIFEGGAGAFSFRVSVREPD